MTEAGLDALIAYSVGNQPGPTGFLSGYEPRFGFRDIAVVIVIPGAAWRLFAYAYWDRPADQAWIEDVVVEPNLGALAAKIAAAVPASAKRVGVAGYLFFPAMLAAAIRSVRPGAELVDASSLLTDAARIKTAAEIALLRECAKQTDAGLRAFLAGVRLGADERSIALGVERAMVMAGAERLAFPVLLFSGSLVETGIGFPAAAPLTAGRQVNIVCGALNGNYKMDLGRVTTVGAPAPAMRSVMDAAAAMHAAMLRAVRPGVTADAIARAGVDARHDRGMDEWEYSGGAPGYAGHGIGCWLDEPPTLKLGESTSIDPGMVLILEARLARTGHGGATITDPILVTAQGAERLSSVPIVTWAG